MADDGAETTRRRYRRIARVYDVVDWPFEVLRYRPLRRVLTRDVAGPVLEAGVGTGRNLAYYAAGTRVAGIDASRAMLARAQRRVPAGGGIAIDPGDITATRFADGAFNTVIASFVLCVLPASAREPALREMRRVCAPDGEIRLLEYTRSAKPWRRAVMRLWEPVVRRVFGASFDADVEGLAERAGLQVATSRYLVDDIIRLVVLRPA